MLTTTVVAREQACTRWDRYVLSHPGGSGYHLMAWRRVMEDAFGHATFYLMVTDEDQAVHGVLPLVFLSSRLFGRLLVSMPYVNYGGLLADTVEAQDALLKAAVDLAKQQGAAHIELRQSEVLGLGWPSKQHKVSMRLELPKRFETLWEWSSDPEGWTSSTISIGSSHEICAIWARPSMHGACSRPS